MRWTLDAIDADVVCNLSQKHGIAPVIAEILCRRGLTTDATTTEFLNPRLANLQDPFAVGGMDSAVRRLRQAMAKDEKILVYGDYDVDGVTSTVLLISVLNQYGIHPRPFVPMRLEEGYGLSINAIERALQDGKPDLLIAVDCGTSSLEQVAYLRQQGIDVIIIDHHTSKDALPEDCILVNPHVLDPETAPWRNLCTVGLVFKFMHALIKQLRQEGDELAHEIRLRDYLDLVALGSVADLVPLLGENRILVKTGLSLLKDTKRLGLRALFQVGGIQPGNEITPFDISFRLGPRINASGRLSDASEPIEMLLSGDWQRCLQAARLLDDCNRERQDIEKAIADEAEAIVEALYTNDPAFVVFNPAWHAGVVGIVASRLTQKYHKPAIVLGAEGPFAKGSGRSVHGVNLVDVLKCCTHLMDKWGGHPMAVGIAMDPVQIEEFRALFCKGVVEHCSGALPEKELNIGAWLNPQDFTEQLLQQLDVLAPFGQGNADPVFAVKGALLRGISCFGNGHFRFALDRPGFAPLSGVAWKQADWLPPENTPLDIAVRLAWNNWQGRKTPQLVLMDWCQ